MPKSEKWQHVKTTTVPCMEHALARTALELNHYRLQQAEQIEAGVERTDMQYRRRIVGDDIVVEMRPRRTAVSTLVDTTSS
ncbi:hypothetical protein [Deinococcus peraridilitoris]|uniref:Uncharacterized protein n=1 Tax=Deinococcus peraridilitoris (strain DSM 19664 / LMG 22246 / CIP 109416 / KR-200) TaxID=937777 RepID=K9ZZN5_DEIPD|nr:hypothetical protein [Deinococcus peraridilitoris]AFZ67088.1 hypothetical protein Deipe_1547 [Deinococcus peraridilitoris DSM 19664]